MVFITCNRSDSQQYLQTLLSWNASFSGPKRYHEPSTAMFSRCWPLRQCHGCRQHRDLPAAVWWQYKEGLLPWLLRHIHVLGKSGCRLWETANSAWAIQSPNHVLCFCQVPSCYWLGMELRLYSHSHLISGTLIFTQMNSWDEVFTGFLVVYIQTDHVTAVLHLQEVEGYSLLAFGISFKAKQNGGELQSQRFPVLRQQLVLILYQKCEDNSLCFYKFHHLTCSPEITLTGVIARKKQACRRLEKQYCICMLWGKSMASSRKQRSDTCYYTHSPYSVRKMCSCAQNGCE